MNDRESEWYFVLQFAPVIRHTYWQSATVDENPGSNRSRRPRPSMVVNTFGCEPEETDVRLFCRQTRVCPLSVLCPSVSVAVQGSPRGVIGWYTRSQCIILVVSWWYFGVVSSRTLRTLGTLGTYLGASWVHPACERSSVVERSSDGGRGGSHGREYTIVGGVGGGCGAGASGSGVGWTCHGIGTC
jgi:hypothetical protein